MSTILSWNCRGAGGPRKHQFLVDILRATRVNIAFISETKRCSKKSKKILDLLPLKNNSLVPARGRSGGLWLLWDDKTSLTIVSKDRFKIHARIHEQGGLSWTLVCVYGDPSHGENASLWDQIRLILSTEQCACVIGDFNAIASDYEKYGGNPAMNSNSRSFRKFLFDAGLIDLGFKGPAYTWTNKPNSSVAIHERLDRAVATAQWMQARPHAFVNHMPRIHSDHCPILVCARNRSFNAKQFRVEKWWQNTEGFKEMCEVGWQQMAGLSWEDRMCLLKKNINAWAKGYKSPQNRIRELKQKILEVQTVHPSLQPHGVEEALLREFEKAETDLETYWKQRSRIQWLCEGDRNTSFFHALATQRRRTNHISHVRMGDGTIMTGEADIRREFVRYFKELYGTATLQQQSDPARFLMQLNISDDCKVPLHAQPLLIKNPTSEEVKATLFGMGPDKAPGPDGITVGFLQQNWGLLGKEITLAIQTIFQTEQVPSQWLASHVILIPKMEEPQNPRDYRPLTIGNTIYRLFMKILANRLQPYMQGLISKQQTAFLKGRNISDNVILVKEVLHSFNNPNYKEASFMLKADVSKAFDTVRWDLVIAAMKEVRIPSKFTSLVHACMKESRTTILVNGSGSGFIKPSRGLRQGCPLSPYLFILAMECLSKQINEAVQKREKVGVKLAPTAPILSHILYADDLMLMGRADQREVTAFQTILQTFAQVSGLVINPNKSTMWFSKACDEDCCDLITNAMGAKLAEEKEKYLGVLMDAAQNRQDPNDELVLEKVYSRLAGWKANQLSHAGRVTLIKSTLISLPVYFMSIATLSRETIDEINQVMRKFLWGKLGQNRYLSLISWEKVCRPVQEGGLGIRNMSTFNETLMLKMVWQLAANKEKTWVQIMKAKYFSRGGFWGIRNTTGTSKFWKEMQRYKSFFTESAKWVISDGNSISVVNQPWFDQWELQRIRTNVQRDTTVASVWDHDNDRWRADVISQLLGQQAFIAIRDSARQPRLNPMLPDRLVWTHNDSGLYTVKAGYRVLAQQRQRLVQFDEYQTELWKEMWTWKGIVPRVRIFVWRALHQGIATAQVLHRRLRTFCPRCPRCGQENESIMHTLFFCPLSQVTWFISSFALRVEGLPLNFAQTLLTVARALDSNQIAEFTNILWCIWKARNNKIFKGEDTAPKTILAQARALTMPELVAPIIPTRTVLQPVLIPRGKMVVVMDASWDSTRRAGAAFVLFDCEGRLQYVQTNHETCADPLQAEAMVLVRVLEYVQQRLSAHTMTQAILCSDCKILVNAVLQRTYLELPSWRAAEMVMQGAHLYHSMIERVTLIHVSRKFVKQPHYLANWARTTKSTCEGMVPARIAEQAELNPEIDQAHFRWGE